MRLLCIVFAIRIRVLISCGRRSAIPIHQSRPWHRESLCALTPSQLTKCIPCIDDFPDANGSTTSMTKRRWMTNSVQSEIERVLDKTSCHHCLPAPKDQRTRYADRDL